MAVVCGTGINCVGIAPDGRHARFPALGAITGDWGGGYDVGLAAVSAAARSEDGRGSETALEQAVPAHFGLATPTRAGGGDPPRPDPAEAARRAAARRLRGGRRETRSPQRSSSASPTRSSPSPESRSSASTSRHEPVEVLLGGGLLRPGNGTLESAIETGLREVGHAITVRNTESPPIVGAALLGLDELGAGAQAQERARRELDDAVAAIEPERAAGG